CAKSWRSSWIHTWRGWASLLVKRETARSDPAPLAFNRAGEQMACTTMPAAQRKFARAKSGHRDSLGGKHAGAHDSAKPVLYRRTRSFPRGDAPLRVARDRAVRP